MLMRQWPAEHFASLIDLLVEQNAVNAVLIGGPEEAELATQVLDQVAHRDAVVSLVGRTPLRELPALLSACALYVGNNSGPKHIAAALGVPTIGIHSGVVDAVEWGPIGKRAVALRRNMTCSPCYLARMEDCPRNFACMRGLEPTIVQEVSEVFLARPVERHSRVAAGRAMSRWRGCTDAGGTAQGPRPAQKAVPTSTGRGSAEAERPKLQNLRCRKAKPEPQPPPPGLAGPRTVAGALPSSRAAVMTVAWMMMR